MTTIATPARVKPDLKVVILGDAEIGKTTLIYRYIEGTFNETIKTLGASFFLKTWRHYNVAVWDTAGEEKFANLSSFYCRGAGGAILAFDIRQRKSFESLRNRFLSLLPPDEGSLLVVLGTKLDLVTSENRAVTREEGLAFAQEINRNLIQEGKSSIIPYFETSSVTGQNVVEAFEFILDYCLPLDGKVREKIRNSTLDLDNPHEHSRKKKTCCS